MMSNRYRASSRRCSVLPTARIRSTACSKRRQNSTNPPVMSNIQGMRGKMSKNCLWHACQALFVGIVLFSIGAVMSTLGFQADGLLDGGNNGTVGTAAATRSYIYNNESRTPHIRFSKLSYAGPIVMGIGGFIIVATCVLTFEARDSAAKVGPASYSGGRNAAALYTNPYRARARSLDVRSVASQTMDEPSSATTTSFTALHIFDKKSLFETFKKFSRTIRTGSSKEDQFHRSPSAPSLLAAASEGHHHLQHQHENDRLTEESENPASAGSGRRASVLPKMKFSPRGPSSSKRGQLRQTMSVDCPSISSASPFILPYGTACGSSKAGAATITKSKPGQGGSSKNVTVITTPQSSSIRELCSSNQSLLPAKSCIATKGRSSSPNSSENNFKYYGEGGGSGGEEHCILYSKAPCSGGSIGSGSSRQGSKCPVTNLNVHFQPATVELHLPNGSVNGSTKVQSKSSPTTSEPCPSSSLPIITCSSPHQQQSSFRPTKCEDNSRHSSSSSSSSSAARPHHSRNEDHVIFKSSSTAVDGRFSSTSHRRKLKTELSCRPMLMRQSRVDHSEIVSLPDSDEDNDNDDALENSAAPL